VGLYVDSRFCVHIAVMQPPLLSLPGGIAIRRVCLFVCLFVCLLVCLFVRSFVLVFVGVTLKCVS